MSDLLLGRFGVIRICIVLLFVLQFCSCSDDSVCPKPPVQEEGPSGWYWQHPLPQGSYLMDICCVDADWAIAVGKCGTIMRTADSGSTWVIQQSHTSYRLECVSFTSRNTGTVIGRGG